MALLTVTNLTTHSVAIQDPTGLYGVSLTLTGSGTLTNYSISLAALSAIESLLIKEATAGNISWSVSDDPTNPSDSPPEHVQTVLTTPYNAVAGDRDIVVHLTVAGATSVVLSAAAMIGQRVTVVDGAGNASSDNITVTVASSGTINGGASNVISTNYGKATYLKIGTTAWLVVG